MDHDEQKCVLLKGGSRNLAMSGPLEHSSAWSYHRKICLGGRIIKKNCFKIWIIFFV